MSTEKGDSSSLNGNREVDNQTQNKPVQKSTSYPSFLSLAHIYSVETIRSYRHDRIDNEISNLNYVGVLNPNSLL